MTETATQIGTRTPPPAAQSVQSPLFDLLARSWTLDAPIAAVAIDKAGKAAGFALADGRVALMPLADPESAISRMRVEADSGRSTIRPREKPVAAPVMTAVIAEGAPCLAVSGQIGLIAAARDGRLHRITPRGQVIAMTRRHEPLTALASDGAGRIAIARDGRTDLVAEEGMASIAGLLTAGSANALAFAPDDGALAVMLDDCLIVGQPGQGYDRHDLGGQGPLVFAPDGGWIAGSNGMDGIWLLRRADSATARIGNFRAPPASVVFGRASDAVFAAGAFRVAGWSLSTPPFADETSGALRTGRAGLVLIEQVATHPLRDLIAFGTADGAVVIAQAGRPDEMALRQADGGAVTALAWSPDGTQLVIGTAAGGAAIVTLPPQMFK